MRVLIVDDERMRADGYVFFATFAAQGLRALGVDATAIVPLHRGYRFAGHTHLMLDDVGELIDTSEDGPLLRLVREADVIFLDHKMPKMYGDEMLRYWLENDINLDDKWVIGCSGSRQEYLHSRWSHLLESAWTSQFLQERLSKIHRGIKM
jgi:CheY-like chemotaxis protein